MRMLGTVPSFAPTRRHKRVDDTAFGDAAIATLAERLSNSRPKAFSWAIFRTFALAWRYRLRRASNVHSCFVGIGKRVSRRVFMLF